MTDAKISFKTPRLELLLHNRCALPERSHFLSTFLLDAPNGCDVFKVAIADVHFPAWLQVFAADIILNQGGDTDDGIGHRFPVDGTGSLAELSQLVVDQLAGHAVRDDWHRE